MAACWQKGRLGGGENSAGERNGNGTDKKLGEQSAAVEDVGMSIGMIRTMNSICFNWCRFCIRAEIPRINS